MRHGQAGRKLNVSPSHRIALFRSLTLALLEHEEIKTTVPKAKDLRWFADRVVTWAKRGDVASRRNIVRLLGSTENSKPGENRVRNAVDRLYTIYAPRFKDRPGGYTQIFKLAMPRAGDSANMCIMRYIPGDDKEKKGKSKPQDKGGKKVQAKGKGKDQEAKAKGHEDKPAKKEASAKADKAEKKAEPQDKPGKAKAKKKD
jgi:large subunit ribosomal protein L17